MENNIVLLFPNAQNNEDVFLYEVFADLKSEKVFKNDVLCVLWGN